MDPGFPNQHTTTTTVTTSTTTTQRNIRFDRTYLRTIPGILKAVQIILDLLGFICITVSKDSHYSRGNWFNTIAMGGFWITGFLLAFYLFHVVEKFSRIPWYKIEFIYCSIWTFCYLLAASLAADYARVSEGFGVAAFFGFCAMVAYGYDAWLKFNGMRQGLIAQGQRDTTKEVTTVSSPAY